MNLSKIGFIVCLILILVIIDRLGKVVLSEQSTVESVVDIIISGVCAIIMLLIGNYLL